MLVVSNGYCAEAGENGSWSRPPEDILESHKSLDEELVPLPENHSKMQLIDSALGYIAVN